MCRSSPCDCDSASARPPSQFISHDHGSVGRRSGRCWEFQLIICTTELKKKRTFRKFSYRGIDLDQYAAPHCLLHPPLLLTTVRQTPRPLIRTTPRRRPRPRSSSVQPRPQAQANGFDQETAQSQARGQAQREARSRQDASPEHDCGAGDDWFGHWYLFGQGIQSGRD